MDRSVFLLTVTYAHVSLFITDDMQHYATDFQSAILRGMRLDENL